jgi:hypothetical protein
MIPLCALRNRLIPRQKNKYSHLFPPFHFDLLASKMRALLPPLGVTKKGVECARDVKNRGNELVDFLHTYRGLEARAGRLDDSQERSRNVYENKSKWQISPLPWGEGGPRRRSNQPSRVE